MSKRHQRWSSKERAGRNYSEKSTPTKKEPYRKQAFAHGSPGHAPPQAQPPTSWESHPGLARQADARVLIGRQRQRGASETSAQPAERTWENQPDLAGGQRPGGAGEEHSAYEFKELHQKLADLTDDELKQVSILPTGSRLEQGSHYIDLNHLEQGEFVAASSMVAGVGHYYVSKKETDYVLWNRLNQVDNPARLDESAPEA